MTDQDFAERMQREFEEENKAYAESQGKMPVAIIGGREYRFTKVTYAFWHRGRGWQIDGTTDDGQVRRYRYDDGGRIEWR